MLVRKNRKELAKIIGKEFQTGGGDDDATG
jgi:hypothetical protein